MVHFVGAGPGAADLITLRGAGLLEEADLVIYAGSLVDPAILGHCSKKAALYDSAELSLSEVTAIIREAEEKSGGSVSIVRLHSGDPSLYGAIREQIDELKRLGITFDITPGVSSFNAAAAALESEYTVAGLSQSVIITRMEGRTAVPQKESLKKLASHGSTMVIFLSMGLVRQVQEALIEGGYGEDAPAAIVYKVTRKEERVIRCRVGELVKTASDNGIRNTALMITGDFLGDKYEKSRLYDGDFTTGFRKGKKKGGISIIAFTDKGEAEAELIREGLLREREGSRSDPVMRNLQADSARSAEERNSTEAEGSISVVRGGGDLSVDKWVRDNFYDAEALVFVAAAGIAVRAAAPYIRSKACDPAVIAVDERGENVIPLLSGHLGGANALAEKIAGITGGRAVITTATDINGCFAVDEWAKRQGLGIINPEMIKTVSSAVLKGERIFFESICPIGEGMEDERPADGLFRYVLSAEGELCTAGKEAFKGMDGPLVRIGVIDTEKPCLKLCPKIGYLGIGCKKGIKKEQIEEAFLQFIRETGLFPEAVREASSIDLKSDEEGLIDFCRDRGLPVRFYTAEKLNALEGEFSSSGFVKETTGVDCVCERSAVLSANGALYIRKHVCGKVTFALALSGERILWENCL
ncbi:MAG: precorrin-4 C(11)-methyltransferase [Lachnospiraceae bacterium]|nr:precorrin-4 C(11)-methyltransferase [Lachnospiraceae bacterium]